MPIAPLLIEEPYQTPPGFLDQPFAYVFDGSQLADGAGEIQNNIININADSDFILRHIAGVPTCVNTPQSGGRFNFRNASGSYANGNPSSGIAFPPNWPVVPEKLYPHNSQLAFDLYQTLRASNACGGTPIYTAQIAFFGVRRVHASGAFRNWTSPYNFRERKYTYSYSLTINWAYLNASGVPQGPMPQTLQLDSYDFELQRIAVTNAQTTGATQSGQPGGLATNDFRIGLYDAQNHLTSGAGVRNTGAADVNLNILSINAARPNATTWPAYQGCWPTPTLVYPAGGQIRFDITSLLCSTQLNQTYNILFDGIWRIPC